MSNREVLILKEKIIGLILLQECDNRIKNVKTKKTDFSRADINFLCFEYRILRPCSLLRRSRLRDNASPL